MRCLLLLYAYIKSLKFAYFTNQIDISTLRTRRLVYNIWATKNSFMINHIWTVLYEELEQNTAIKKFYEKQVETRDLNVWHTYGGNDRDGEVKGASEPPLDSSLVRLQLQHDPLQLVKIHFAQVVLVH